MDAIIILLIIFGLISRFSKKKQREENARKAQTQAEAHAQAAAVQAKKSTEPKKPEPPRRPAPAGNARQNIPFTKEEWAQFLSSEGIQAGKPAPAAMPEGTGRGPGPSPEGRASRRQPLPEGVSPALKATQGESEAEHRRHVERIVREETRVQADIEAQQALRSMNRKRLREAVIMSEILSKPVALRPRGQR